MSEFHEHQKWISTAEPELGIGRITQVSDRTVSLTYDLASEQRTYARQKAPLTRVEFKIGDLVTSRDDITICVETIEEKDALMTYYGPVQNIEPAVNGAIGEIDLDPNLRFSKPEDRLFTHQLDDNSWFNLRYNTRQALARLAKGEARGLYGPRVSLIPHQLYIGHEVAQRFAPRVLLADEVGLGKTIEAGLIIHQQLITGRAARVLIMVPPALTFQWFVEMIRRFNLHFTVLDEERCQLIIADNAAGTGDYLNDSDEERDNESMHGTRATFNPFEAQQLMLCNLDLFLDNPRRLEQALATEWDLMVVDEAHHLQWTPHAASPEYQLVEQLANVAQGLLLLTATPEQLGREGHFARLRLLDPSRYQDFARFQQEERHFAEIAEFVRQLSTNVPSASGHVSSEPSLSAALATQQKSDQASKARLALLSMTGIDVDKPVNDNALIDAVLDRYGTGRVLFRNVRASVKGFPRRIALPHALPAPSLPGVDIGYFPEDDMPDWTSNDPRISWLANLIVDHPDVKILLICARRSTVMALDQTLQGILPVRTTLFHEGMDLVSRDRAANYFAETDRGAQLMLCSEIGSEGRNFQFASHLVLFDLPLGPDLLEQRIGRLDRIGQRQDVKIHIPYIEHSATARLYQWYAEGLGLFVGPNAIAQGLFDELYADFEKIGNIASQLKDFIGRSKTLNEARQSQLKQGRDQLLALNSHRPDVSARIVTAVDEQAGGAALMEYMELSFERFGLESEPLGDAVWRVKPSDTMARHYAVSAETMDHFHYPELPEDGLRYTFDRATALAREDVLFLTWEHPLVQQAIDLVSSDIHGNSTMIAVKHPDLPAGTLLVETLYIADCVAPKGLMVDRYLPPRVIRLLMQPGLTDISDHMAWNDFEVVKLDVPKSALGGIVESQRGGIKKMLEAARTLAKSQLMDLRTQAADRAATALDLEIDRLSALQRINDTVRSTEIEHLKETRSQLLQVIARADVRLDGIRIIVAA
ncbi:MAG: ATP-dependent helicase HepA [Candidatus Azotimanducaceae bacterium]|jgi:ATP-dependent helicase HepA